uniref:Uncharacterized protein n=1 Tax=Anopheles arabiensis TaxID=7173 RepID=A0A182HRH1_ANOAR
MQTKWTKLTSHLKEYFAFYENFITQVHGTSHVMSGMVAKAHPSCEGFPYSRTIYANDPTENKQYQGLPGKEYTVLDGMVETINVRTDPTHTFQRNFTYNEPGFLIKLADNYLTESVSYLETDSYGQDSYTPIYEGLISKTLFTAHWQKAASPLRNGIYTEYLMSDNMNRAQASLCLEVLKRTGFIDENNLVNRTLYGDMNDDLPSAGDVQSYKIDANGNHRKFYTGFSRYRLEYQEGTNKINKLYRQQFDRAQGGREEFTMAHDGDGALIQAEHKGIKHMAYDKLLQRVSEIEMTDGRKILYQYDVRAERTFKQVRGKDGKVMSEKYYIRDANGLVLMDMDMSYLASDHPPDVRVTSYIYKDQQLIGFVRNDKLYGVITDHEGSVRLVGGEFDMTKWDYSDPALYMSFVDGFTTATVGVLFLRNLPRQISKWSGKETSQFWVIQTGMEIVQICLFVPFLSSEAVIKMTVRIIAVRAKQLTIRQVIVRGHDLAIFNH